MLKIKIVVLLLCTCLVSSLASASDDYSNSAGKEIPRINETTGQDNYINNTVINSPTIKIDSRNGYISLPHITSKSDMANCIIDNLKVELSAPMQLKMSFDDSVDAAFIRVRSASRVNEKPILEEHILKNNNDRLTFSFKNNGKQKIEQDIFEVHSFTNTTFADKKIQYYLWLKTDDDNTISEQNQTTKSYQLWLKGFLDKIDRNYLALLIKIATVGVAYLIYKENKNDE